MSYKSERRTTAWTFVCYPESMPEDWESRMRALHVPLAYVLHDRDREGGLPVKPHVHVLVRYESVKARDQVVSDFEFTGIRFIEQVRSFNAMTRYLCHMDDPDKVRYDPSEVVACSGLSLDFSRHLSPDEQLDLLQEITAWVEDNDVREYSTLWSYAAAHERTWMQVLTGKASHAMTTYIRSRTYGKR